MQQDITVSAERALIEKARARALAWGTTLEDELRRWLEIYAREEADAAAWMGQQLETMEKLRRMSA
ncbi:MAG: hypothetical protein ACLPX9_12635 [Rhodomicrobium sp.]